MEITHKIEKEDFKGQVKFTIPKYRQRVQYAKKMQFKADAEGNIEVGEDAIDSVIALIDCAEKHFTEVSIEHVETGEKANSFEELEIKWQFEPIIPELCSLVLNGGRLGNA